MINPKQLVPKIVLSFFLFSVFFVVSGFQPQTPPAYAASCTIPPVGITAGQTFNVGGLGFDPAVGLHSVSVIGTFPTAANTFNDVALMSYNAATGVWSATVTMPATAPGGEYVVRVGSTECLPHLTVTATADGEGGSAECDNFSDCTTIPGIPGPDPATFGDDTFIVDLVSQILPIAIGIGGFLSVIIVIISGLQFITSNGNPEGAAAARGRLIFALVGFVLLTLAFAITKVIDTLFLRGSGIF